MIDSPDTPRTRECGSWDARARGPVRRVSASNSQLGAIVVVIAAAICGAAVPSMAIARGKKCPSGMVTIGGRFCIDPYEGMVEEKHGKRWVAHSPFESVASKDVRAASKRGVIPQAYISRNESAAACQASHKRLCREDEWRAACKGRAETRYPYGDEHRAGFCNDAGVSPLNHFFGAAMNPDSEAAYGWGPMNDSRLNQLAGTVARAGTFRKCTNSFKVYDLVGNLHEWIEDPSGTFRGGYYLDTRINGEGCDYRTVAHDANYHDYSTGFRCCADLR